MSLIHFRGQPILSPLIKKEINEETDFDTQISEDDIILSLPTSEALKAILCGLPEHLKSKPSDNSYETDRDDKDNLMDCKGPLESKFNYGENVNNDNVLILSADKVSSSNVSDVVQEKTDKDPMKSIGSLSRNCTGESFNEPSNISSDSLKIFNSVTESTKFDNYESSTSSRMVLGVSNNQKLKALKSSGANSSSYLQDYLQLLTSRSELTRVRKSKKETDLKNNVFLERRGSAPSLSCKKYSPSNSRQRNSSGSSDKSCSYRSLGSIYLDSYLGTLTDHSWIIYPTNDADSTSSHSKLQENQDGNYKSLDLNEGDYLQRRLRFINPEKFFNADIKVDDLEKPSHSTPTIKSSSSVENDNDQGLTDTSGIVLSPDISSSSLDTDKLDSNVFSTSLHETGNIKESPNSQELSEGKDSNKENSSNTDTSDNYNSNNEDLSKQNVNEHSEITSRNDSSKILLTLPHETTKEEELEEDKSTIGYDTSSDISTDDEAEDQVSMIICDVQRSSDPNYDSKESLCDDSLGSKPTSSVSVTDQTCSDSLKTKNNSDDNISANSKNEQDLHKSSELSQSDGLLSNLITILKEKQEEELKELKRRHEWEMNTFSHNLSKLSSSQIHSVYKSYESSNKSVNEIIKLVHNMTSNIPHANNVNDNSNRAPQEANSLTSSRSHVNLTPSFFLHDETQDSISINRPDVNKISQIFSPSKGNVQNVTKFFSINKNSKLTNDVKEKMPDIKECPKSSDSKKYVSFSPRQFEFGLDLVPTRESDGLFTSIRSSLKQPVNLHHRGICKLQAIVKGKRIRKLMRTSQVQQLLSTLKEVAKLAHQFHQDILLDNIRKGDIGFHKALYNEEQQAREKLIKIMVGLGPRDQIRLIQKDRMIEERENQRKINVNQISISNANHIPRLKFTGNANTSLELTSNKGQSSPRSVLGSPFKSGIKQIARKVYASDLPRPCKSTVMASEIPKSPSRYNSIPSPREKQSQIPSMKTVLNRGNPRQKIIKKIDSLPQTHIPPPRRQNTPICKSEIATASSMGSKAGKVERVNIPLRDGTSSRKPWR